MERKARLSVYLDPQLTRALVDYAGRRDRSRSLVAEAAIAPFLSPDADERREAATTKRLDGIDRRIQRLERDIGIAVETMALFVRFWLYSTPQLPETLQAATRVKAGERYENFVEALGRRLAKGPKLLQESASIASHQGPSCRPRMSPTSIGIDFPTTARSRRDRGGERPMPTA
jgi:predicted transcriptional regulator